MKNLLSTRALEAISCCGKTLQLNIIRAAVYYSETGEIPPGLTSSTRMALSLMIALAEEEEETPHATSDAKPSTRKATHETSAGEEMTADDVIAVDTGFGIITGNTVEEVAAKVGASLRERSRLKPTGHVPLKRKNKPLPGKRQ